MGRTMVQERTLYNAVTFRRLLDSMARPGKINQLEYPHFVGEWTGASPIGTNAEAGYGRQGQSLLGHLQDGRAPEGDERPMVVGGQGSAPAFGPMNAPTSTQPIEMSVNLYALGAMLTLLDREVSFAVAVDGQWLSQTSPIVQWLMLRSGSAVAAPESAMFAFFGQGRSDGLIMQLSRGTLLEPEASATVFYCVERLVDADLHSDGQLSKREVQLRSRSARVRLVPLGQIQQLHAGWYEEAERVEGDLDWVTLELIGPGIECMHRMNVRGLDRGEVELINLTRRGYPLGIDVYLIDALGHCVGLPRTTRIRIIE